MTTTLFDPARLPARDAIGHVYHPDLPDYDNEEPYRPKLHALGFEAAFVEMSLVDHDAYEALQDPDLSWWTPSPPAGSAWTLAAVEDTENGPHAVWVRPLVGWRVTWDRHDDATAHLLTRAGTPTSEATVASWPDNRVRDAEGWAAAVLMRAEGQPGIDIPPRPHWLHEPTESTAATPHHP